MKVMKLCSGFTLGLVLAVLVACGTNSTANSTLDQRVTALEQKVATLQTQLQTLQNTQPAVFIKAPNAPVVAVRSVQSLGSQSGGTSTRAVANCTGIGTLTGRPNTSDPIATSNASGISCTGYYFTVSEARSSTENAEIQPLPGTLAILFDGANCMGTPYMSTNFALAGNPPLGKGAVTNGAVFRWDPKHVGASDASTYYMITAGQTPAAGVTIQSFEPADSTTCTNSTFTNLTLYQLMANDPAVTGLNSATVPGPVIISN